LHETALLQTLVVLWFVRFANVMFWALAVHYIAFLYLSLYIKMSVVSLFTLVCNFFLVKGNLRNLHKVQQLITTGPGETGSSQHRIQLDISVMLTPHFGHTDPPVGFDSKNKIALTILPFFS
jgi:hypothetical protein